jgi:hypothetical protein
LRRAHHLAAQTEMVGTLHFAYRYGTVYGVISAQ